MSPEKFNQTPTIYTLLYEWFTTYEPDTVTDWWRNHVSIGSDPLNGRGLLILYDDAHNYTKFAQPFGIYRIEKTTGNWDRLMPLNLADPQFFSKLSEFIDKYGRN